MQSRTTLSPATNPAVQALLGVEERVRQSGLASTLLDLLRLRVSQINGCAYCIDMHWKDLRAAGETEQRLYELNAWRESPFYTDRERAALAWAEALTLVTEGHVPDAVFQEASRHFTEQELSYLSLAVVAINSWNRLSIAFRTVPGSYQAAHPRQTPAAA